MNISISNWHKSSFESTKMNFLIYFSSLHDYWPPTTLISLVHNSLGEMVWCEKRAFQLLKMRKMSQLKHKIQVRNSLFWQLGLRVWRIILVITWWAHKRQTFTLISIKLMWILKFFVYNNLVFKQKGVVFILRVCCNGLGEMWDSYIFHFLQRILTSTHKKNLIFFCIIYFAMSNIHFSGLDNVKMICQTQY